MEPHLPKDEPFINNLVLANLKVPMYQISASELDTKVTCVTSYLDHIFVGTVYSGLYIYRYQHGNLWPVYQICGNKPSDKSPQSHSNQGTSVYDVTVTSQHLVYFKEENSKTYLCVHKTYDTLCGKLKPSRMLETKRRAPMLADSETGLIVVGGAAWTSSWTSSGDSESQFESDDIQENAVRVIDMSTFDTVKDFKVTDNAVSLLRMQNTDDHTMLGVADTRTGLTVFDLRQPNEHSYECLYKVPVDEIRNFQIVGKFVGVFHKFEPNITFWNLTEQKTILCINIQDQMRQLAEEFLEDEDDIGLYDTEDDYVTSVCSAAAAENDVILMYGTRSGCVFGMSVCTRTKLFNIPCPYGSPEGLPIKMNVQGIAFLQGGKLAIAYEKQGLTLLDFGVENPPDRPPTRHMKRPKTS